MILVIGGAASGKLDYVCSLGYDWGDCSDAHLDESPVIFNLQRLIELEGDQIPFLFESLLEKEVVVCDEVGSGVIPANRDDRDAREATGRMCIKLAQHAEKVVRLVAGIPTVIKG
ncbi:MAG: bifunctional adenosylcobinamide kinase/adenosylcobinamide-phosphate guanylyltransferase [Eggerthellaceae bacterium]|nr:bifunctional adenosylcobinamide kinase/adenosylcobinamide-phosphate guanylyltransferase [Eggerthellaceae bacterium]